MVNWSGAGTGAAGGAAVGTAILPGWGTAIGGAAGGLIGAFSGGGDGQQGGQFRDRQQIMDLINRGYGPGGITSQQAPQVQASQMNMGYDPFRRGQLQQVHQLQGIASGQQQGAGELAAQRQVANALAAQQAYARMARGGNAALAYRNGANQAAAVGLSGVGMGQQAALQDQQAAQGQLVGALSYGRQGDINVAGQNASLSQQAALNNAALQSQQQQYNSGNYLALLNSLGNMNATELTGQNNASMMNAQRNDALLGAGISAGGQILAQYLGRGGNQQTPVVSQPAQAAPVGVANGVDYMNDANYFSDRALKTNIQPGGDAANSAIASLGQTGAQRYTYRDQALGEGQQVGVMAQDLQRAGLGQAVVPTERGLAVDSGKLTGANTAMIAELGKRIAALEGQRTAQPQVQPRPQPFYDDQGFRIPGVQRPAGEALYDVGGNLLPPNVSPAEQRAAEDRNDLYRRWAMLQQTDPQAAKAQQDLNMRRAALERMGPPPRDKFAMPPDPIPFR